MKFDKKTVGLILSGLLWLLQNLNILPTATDASGLNASIKPAPLLQPCEK